MFFRFGVLGIALFFFPETYAEFPGQYLESLDLAVGMNHVCANTVAGVKCFGNAEEVTTKVPADLKNISQLQAGSRFTCGITGRGIRCWGEIPGSRKRDMLIKKRELKNPRLLAVGVEHACAVGDNDQVKCWGKNEQGEGTVPPGLKNITELSAGLTNTCAIADKKVVCWGIQSTGSTQVPEGLINPRQLTSGWWHHCVQTDEGPRCWGHPFRDQVLPDDPSITTFFSGGLLNCGVGRTGVKCWDETGKTQQLSDSESARVLKVGSSFVCALTPVHGLMCWSQRSGQFKRMLSFVPAGGLSHIEWIAAGNASTCIYGDDDEVKCWGNNPEGALDVPKKIPGPLYAFSLGARRLCTLEKNGPKCYGSEGRDFDVPKNLSDITMISSGGYQICAAGNQKVYCWGEDVRDGLQVPTGLSQITQLTSGFTHACAVANSQTTCWGGTGLIQGVNPSEKMENPRAICAGGTFSCAIESGGRVNCWGSQIPWNQLWAKELQAESAKAVLNVPRTIQNAVELACGLSHACALYNGQVKCWGNTGWKAAKLAPKIAVKNPHHLTAGWNHTCVLGDDGLSCWGEGSNLEMPTYSLEK